MLKAINIKWDVSDEKLPEADIKAIMENENLPEEVAIPENIEEEDICDYLSDEYGYCVFGFDIVTVKGFRGLFIDGTRSGYVPEQCYETMTVNQMIEKLIELRDYDNAGDCPIHLSNDNGYTYGHINADTMNLGTYTEYNGVEIEERW